MIVVSNTSPLNYLLLVELAYLLEPLFGHLLIPQAVADEPGALGAPDPVRAFFDAKPDWVEIRRVGEISEDLFRLDPGEREAIALAIALGADLILLDERKARIAARERGLAVAGTLGVLDLAARRELIDLNDAVGRLARTNFRIRPALLSSLVR
jgi:predicted nucleic acid-binding protein